MSAFTFLKSQSNLLCVADKQNLNGAEVINLAGKEALYIVSKSNASMDKSTTESTASLLQKNDRVLEKLKVRKKFMFCSQINFVCSILSSTQPFTG